MIRKSMPSGLTRWVETGFPSRQTRNAFARRSCSNKMPRPEIASSAGAAADVDHVAVADGGVLVHEAGDQHPPVEGDDFAVLFAAGRSGRADIVLAALAALQAQFLRRRLVGQMHDHAAGGAGADH